MQKSDGAWSPVVINRTGGPLATQSDRGVQFALQHGGKDLFPVFFLARDGLRGFEALFQAEPELGLTEAQDAGAVRQLEEKQFKDEPRVTRRLNAGIGIL
jgi:hypothetical protein